MIEIYKERYKTCLEALEEWRTGQGISVDETLSYAGVLDPMAEGVLPILVGKEENQNRVRFTQAKKRYEFEVLIGVSTDTYDLLGLVTKYLEKRENFSVDAIKDEFLLNKGKLNQVVPMFANKKYKGKALWEWGRAGVFIPEEERPVNKVEVFESGFLGERELEHALLIEEIERMRELVTTGFRKDAVFESWMKHLSNGDLYEWKVLSFSVFVSKGFFIRKLVEDMSKKIGVPMLVYSLKRTSVVYL